MDTQVMSNHTIEKFNVIGISTRTINTNGQSAIDIEALWQKFWGQELQHQIPNKVNNDIYAIYTDYESDFTGVYTTIIGIAVSTLESIPEGMVGVSIETNTYQKIVSKGKMPEAVGNTWLAIWADKELDSKRAYKADFTIHGEMYYDGDHAEVETYLSIF